MLSAPQGAPDAHCYESKDEPDWSWRLVVVCSASSWASLSLADISGRLSPCRCHLPGAPVRLKRGNGYMQQSRASEMLAMITLASQPTTPGARGRGGALEPQESS